MVVLLLILLQILEVLNAYQQPANAISSPEQTPLKRVKIVQSSTGYTVRTSSGQLLRGGAIWVYQYGRETGLTDHIGDEKYWKLLRGQGVNAVRLVFFDPWQRSHGDRGTRKPYPHADLNNPADVEAMLRDFDRVVAMAKLHGLYVLINYHDTGGYRDPDYRQPADDDRRFPSLATMNYLHRFWELVAPRFAETEHVFYELTNEPVRWSPEDYTASVLSDLYTVYKHVRKLAPKTHLVLLSFANHQSQHPAQHSMLGVARKMRAKGVDFSNASVGFHPYNFNHPRPNNAEPILELMREFPVLNTEQNFPQGVLADSSDPDASGFSGDWLGVQSMERLGISWFHWNIDTPRLFRENFMERVVADAKRKGYFWKDAVPTRGDGQPIKNSSR